MPWQPDPALLTTRDPRIDPYRDRTARLVDADGTVVGTMTLTGSPTCRQTGGHLWWRRWGDARETLYGTLELADGTWTDWFTEEDALEDDLRHLAADRYEVLGTLYRVEWEQG